MSAAFVVLAAFLAGLVSFSSPCCLPLLPGYVAYVGGDPDLASPRRTMVSAGLFVVGFGATFTALGASASWVGGILLGNRPVLVLAAGLLAVMGMATFLGAGLPWLAVERRLIALHPDTWWAGVRGPARVGVRAGLDAVRWAGAGRVAGHRRRQPHRRGGGGPVGSVCRGPGCSLPVAGLGGGSWAGRDRPVPPSPSDARLGRRGAAGGHRAGHGPGLLDPPVRPPSPAVRSYGLAAH